MKPPTPWEVGGRFDEVATAYSWWQHAGRPHRDRYGITITAEGQSVWLDDPTQPVTPRD